MKVRGKNSSKYPSVYRYIKNDTFAWWVGFALLAVTAVATVLGFMPQDVKEGSWVWWYELSINIVACLVLIGLGGIFPGIRRREEEYGLAFDKQQWTWMIALVLASIVFNVWLGGSTIKLRALYIVIESVIALLAVWLIGRRLPKGAKASK